MPDDFQSSTNNSGANSLGGKPDATTSIHRKREGVIGNREATEKRGPVFAAGIDPDGDIEYARRNGPAGVGQKPKGVKRIAIAVAVGAIGAGCKLFGIEAPTALLHAAAYMIAENWETLAMISAAIVAAAVGFKKKSA